MFSMRPFLFWGLLGGVCSLAVATDPVVFRSGSAPVPLVELFTSEGCSSCPPAEKWLGELRTRDGLWDQFVPVAWHVNYWDRLGWTDPFARPVYTDRQYAYASRWSTRRVYTPGLVRGGEEWRIQEGGITQPGASSGGELIAEVTGPAVEVSYSVAAADQGELRVNVARLGGGIASHVRAGENRGRRLKHEFLVLGWSQQRLHEGRARLLLPDYDESIKTTRQALAIWISRGDDPTPLQATGGWLADQAR